MCNSGIFHLCSVFKLQLHHDYGFEKALSKNIPYLKSWSCESSQLEFELAISLGDKYCILRSILSCLLSNRRNWPPPRKSPVVAGCDVRYGDVQYPRYCRAGYSIEACLSTARTPIEDKQAGGLLTNWSCHHPGNSMSTRAPDSWVLSSLGGNLGTVMSTSSIQRCLSLSGLSVLR